MEPICQKDMSPGIGECCCNCANHFKDFHHPCTTGESIMKQRGWICFIDSDEDPCIMFSGWSEHGMCELWRQKKEKKDGNHRCTGRKICKS